MWMPRFRIWMLMIAVALAGIGMACARLSPRRQEFAWKAQYNFNVANSIESGGIGCVRYEPKAEYTKRVASYHRRLHLKYAHATRYPWLPIKPDPPNPLP